MTALRHRPAVPLADPRGSGTRRWGGRMPLREGTSTRWKSYVRNHLAVEPDPLVFRSGDHSAESWRGDDWAIAGEGDACCL